jgi:hypothetical protein
MARINMKVRRGAPITFGNFNKGPGDVSLLTNRKATLRLATPDREVDESAPVAAQFTITPRAAAGDIPAGFDFTVSGDITKTLESGVYAVNVALGAGGTPLGITEPLFILIERTTTDDVE